MDIIMNQIALCLTVRRFYLYIHKACASGRSIVTPIMTAFTFLMDTQGNGFMMISLPHTTKHIGLLCVLRVVLCCVVLCCVVLCCAVLCCAVLCCAVLWGVGCVACCVLCVACCVIRCYTGQTDILICSLHRKYYEEMYKQTKESCMRVQDDKKTMLTAMTPMSLPDLPPSLDLPCY